MLTVLDAPCWRLTNPDGTDYDEGDGAQHHNTEMDAADQAVAVADRHFPEPDPVLLVPKPYTSRCVLIVCDGCGADPEDDAWATIHFPDQATARSMASAYDYKITTGPGGARKVLCPDCVCKRDPADDDE